MNRLKIIAALIALVLVSANASAHSHGGGGGQWHGGGHSHGDGHWHGHGHIDFFLGVPLGVPWYYPYYPEVVTVTSPQVVYYAEQNPAPQASPSPLPTGWWYYCPNPAGYYPNVQSCNQPWQPVAPRPPAQ